MMNRIITKNFSKTNLSLLHISLLAAISIVGFLYSQDAIDEAKYIAFQRDSFLTLNHYLAQFPDLQNNLTQLGDCFILFCFVSPLFVKEPKIWEALITSSLFSLIFTAVLKKIFSVPRPAAILDHNSFVIIGKALTGNNSLPSGHSVTIFTSLTVIMFGVMPNKIYLKMGWCFFILSVAFSIAFTRVGVGAHYPLDVFIGAIVGYTCGVLGILFTKRYKLWNWIGSRRYYPLFILLFLVSYFFLINKIIEENLVIYTITILFVTATLYLLISDYAKERF